MSEKTALVTGGGRGLGRSIVLGLAEKGWRVALNYRRDQTAADQTLSEARQLGGDGLIIQADISHAEGRTKLFTAVRDAYGHINLLVNNADITQDQRVDLLELSEESYDRVMAVNLKGPFFLSQLVARDWLEAIEAGEEIAPRMVNINSIFAYTSSMNRGEYCISKAGMAMMTKLFAERFTGAGIQVYEIRTGIINSGMNRIVKRKYDDLFDAGLTPLQRWGEPEDVARAVVAVAEGALPYSTGEVINVDGGFHLHRL